MKETAAVRGIRITNPQKAVYEKPPLRKIDVVEYYDRVAERMLPYLEKRLLSVVRCHKGIGASCFFKKHPASRTKGTVIVPVENSEGEESDYYYIKDSSGLISEAQLGTIEFHVWGSRVGRLEKPDMMVFDLDPDEGLDTERVRRGVRDLKSVLDRLSLISFLKVSGGKGYHVVVPFAPTAGWDAFRDFSKGVADVMVAQWPDLYTTNIRKAKRKGKIFIDWVRNGRGATSVAPYSLRARKGACVSMPIAWEELDSSVPNGISMADALKRLENPDPWKDFFEVRQRLGKN